MDNDYKISFKLALQCLIAQKILRINSQVPWYCHWTSVVNAPEKIVRITPTGRPGLGPGSYIQAINGIYIGRNVRIGPCVKIISANHNFFKFGIHDPSEPIIIGDNCWIGAGAIILPGVELGNHTIVGAGAVVTKSFPKGDCVIAGNPAKEIKEIPPYGNQ